MKILLAGLGSIGRKHLSCLQETGDVELAAYRTAKGILKEDSGIREFFSLQDAMDFNPDGVVVSNPTALHCETAFPFLQKGIRVLIEKPIAHSLAEVQQLEPYSQNIRVAYCMRFLPISSFVKELSVKEKIFKAGFKRSHYLPFWHPYADYRKEYTARKELGGGAIRTLSHELDLMIHWFGKPTSVIGLTDKISPLEIDTDDFAFFTCQTSTGARVNFELDFFSPEIVNLGEIYTDKGKYSWDLQSMKFTSYAKAEESHEIMRFDESLYSEMYMQQAQDFVSFLKTGESINANYNEAVQVLELIEKIDV